MIYQRKLLIVLGTEKFKSCSDHISSWLLLRTILDDFLQMSKFSSEIFIHFAVEFLILRVCLFHINDKFTTYRL